MIREMASPKHGYPGRLFVFEGLDGSGKSTQAMLLGKWLASQGYRVFQTEWNSSELVSNTIKRGKKKGLLTPTTFSLLHATDFADRFDRKILPPLRAGYVVVCDRYSYTAFVRDGARGCDPDWVRMIYSFAPTPDRGVLLPGPRPRDARPKARVAHEDQLLRGRDGPRSLRRRQ